MSLCVTCGGKGEVPRTSNGQSDPPGSVPDRMMPCPAGCVEEEVSA